MIHQLNIIKVKKRDYKKKLAKIINFFLKKKKKRRKQYGRERYKNLLENEKQKLREYKKNITK